jgi:hypothetical protein
VRSVRPSATSFDEVISSSPEDSIFLVRHGLCVPHVLSRSC